MQHNEDGMKLKPYLAVHHNDMVGSGDLNKSLKRIELILHQRISSKMINRETVFKINGRLIAPICFIKIEDENEQRKNEKLPISFRIEQELISTSTENSKARYSMKNEVNDQENENTNNSKLGSISTIKSRKRSRYEFEESMEESIESSDEPIINIDQWSEDKMDALKQENNDLKQENMRLKTQNSIILADKKRIDEMHKINTNNILLKSCQEIKKLKQENNGLWQLVLTANPDIVNNILCGLVNNDNMNGNDCNYNQQNLNLHNSYQNISVIHNNNGNTNSLNVNLPLISSINTNITNSFKMDNINQFLPAPLPIPLVALQEINGIGNQLQEPPKKRQRLNLNEK